MRARTPRLPIVLSCLMLLTFACVAENTAEPPEDVTNFHPVRMYPAIAEYAGADARLIEMEARYVRADGSMDLSADYRPLLRYKFIRKRKTGAKKPLGTGDRHTHETFRIEIHEGKFRNVRRDGISTSYYFRGMERSEPTEASPRDIGRQTAAPTCLSGELWRAAREAGAPETAVATIRYNWSGYSFSIDETDYKLNFDTNCKPLAALSPAKFKAARQALLEQLKSGAIDSREYRERARQLLRRR